MFSHRNTPEPTDGPSISANVPEGLRGPAFHPLSPLLMALASHFRWHLSFPINGHHIPGIVSPSQRPLPNLPAFLPSLPPFGQCTHGQREQQMGKGHTLLVRSSLGGDLLSHSISRNRIYLKWETSVLSPKGHSLKPSLCFLPFQIHSFVPLCLFSTEESQPLCSLVHCQVNCVQATSSHVTDSFVSELNTRGTTLVMFGFPLVLS